MPDRPATAEPRRRWYQTGLRTLLIGVALVGLLTAGIVPIVRLWQSPKFIFTESLIGHDRRFNP
jgi:hypothetical protein